MALEGSLSLCVILSLKVVRHVLQDGDVRLDSLCLDRSARRRVITRCREPDGTVILAKRDDRLHRSLAEGTRAENNRALVILQRTSDDFRSRCRAAIDQDHHRLAL